MPSHGRAHRATVPRRAPRAACLLVTLAAAAGYAGAQSEPRQPPATQSAIRTQTVAIRSGDAEIKCYLAHPEGDGPFPGMLLIHEWWGLNDWVREQADRLARRGFAALAVDLYRGELARDAEHAHELSRGLPDERALADMEAAFEFLSGHALTRGRKIGVIGWCMGGGQALALAVAEHRLACTVVCYGRPITDPDRLRRIAGPILGIWGETDRGIDVQPFRAALERAGVRATHHVHPGVGHAFMNPNNQRGYNEAAARRAWEQIDAFLDEQLRR